MSNVIGHATLNVVPSTKGFGSALKGQLGGEFDSTGKAGGKSLGGGMLAGFGAAVLGPAGIATAGVAAMGAFVAGTISAAGELEQSRGAIDAVFKGTSPAMHEFAANASSAFGLTANEANNLATVLGSQLKNGGTAVEELGGKTTELIGVGADLAAMFGGTTSDAVGALSSALKGERDPIERYGVSLTQAAIDAQAAAMGFEKVGGSLSAEATQAATLALIMQQTADAHGAAARESGSLQARQAQLSAGWENLKATIGTAFLPAASSVTGVLADIVNGAGPLINQIGPGLSSLFATVGPAFTELGGALVQLLPSISPLGILFQGLAPVLPQIGALLAQIATVMAGVLTTAAQALAPVIAIIADVISRVLAAALPIVSSLFTALGPILTVAGELFAALAEAVVPLITQIADFLIPIIEALMPVVEVVFGLITDIIKVALDVIQGVIQVVTSAIEGDWDAVWDGIKGILEDAWDGITSAVDNALGDLETWFKDLWPNIQGWLGDVGDWLYDTGSDLIQGLLDGIGSMAGDIWDAINAPIEDAIAGVKDFLGIASPSKLMRQLGEWTGEGFAIGLADTDDQISAAGLSLASTAVDSLSGVEVGNVEGGIAERTAAAITASLAGITGNNYSTTYND